MNNGTVTLPDSESEYGYRPTLWVCIFFTAFFGLLTAIHLAQAIASRRWLLGPTIVLGGCGEILGWAARLWSSRNVWSDTPYKIQISCLIISPTFLSAANFIFLGHIIGIIGQRYSFMSAKLFGRVFVTADVASLVVQAVGGGIASAAETIDGADKGGNIMLAGIVVQFVSMTIYSILGLDFARRVVYNKPVRSDAQSSVELNENPSVSSTQPVKPSPNSDADGAFIPRKIKFMGFGLALSTFILLVRGVYRIIELSDGWNGVVIHTEIWFNIFDGLMIVLAMITMNIFHPGWLLPRT